MVAAIHNRSFVLDVQCWNCTKWYSIILNKQDLVDYSSGSVGISAMDYLNDSERELIMSQTCGSCFDSLFAPLDNDE